MPEEKKRCRIKCKMKVPNPLKDIEENKEELTAEMDMDCEYEGDCSGMPSMTGHK